MIKVTITPTRSIVFQDDQFGCFGENQSLAVCKAFSSMADPAVLEHLKQLRQYDDEVVLTFSEGLPIAG